MVFSGMKIYSVNKKYKIKIFIPLTINSNSYKTISTSPFSSTSVLPLAAPGSAFLTGEPNPYHNTE